MGALEHPKGQRVVVPDGAEGFYLDHGWKHAGESEAEAERVAAEEAAKAEAERVAAEEAAKAAAEKGAASGGKPEADAGGSAGVPAKRTRATARKG